VQPSITQTYALAGVGNGIPSRLFQAAKVPIRLVVRNTGGTVVFIAHDTQSLASIQNVGGAYPLPAGQADVFVLAPGQPIYAIASGGGGQCAIAASEAFPVSHWMES